MDFHFSRQRDRQRERADSEREREKAVTNLKKERRGHCHLIWAAGLGHSFMSHFSGSSTKELDFVTPLIKTQSGQAFAFDSKQRTPKSEINSIRLAEPSFTSADFYGRNTRLCSHTNYRCGSHLFLSILCRRYKKCSSESVLNRK